MSVNASTSTSLSQSPSQASTFSTFSTFSTPTTVLSIPERSCDDWKALLHQINNYFRDEMVVNGTDYASVTLGYLVVTAYALVICFGAAGNLLTMLAVARSPSMRTTRNFFIVNLALSDFFVCTVTAPITLYTVLYMFWPFSTVFCKIAGTLQGFNIFLSTFSITAIALDRYVLVIFPTSQRMHQHRLSLLFFTGIWLCSMALALPLLMASDVNVILEETKCNIKMQLCFEQNEIWKKMPLSREAYTLGAVGIQYALPLISMAFVYTRIAHRMRMRFHRPSTATSADVDHRRRSAAGRQRRTHLLLACVVVVFALAWLPLNVFHLVNTFRLTKSFSVPTFAVCHLTAMCSACLNPVIYAFFNHNFRQQFVEMFHQVGLGHLRSLLIRIQKWTTDTRHKANTTRLTVDDCSRLPPLLSDVVVMVNTV